LVPMPRERRVGNIVVSSLVCLNTKMTRDFGENIVVSSLVCLNTKMTKDFGDYA